MFFCGKRLPYSLLDEIDKIDTTPYIHDSLWKRPTMTKKKNARSEIEENDRKMRMGNKSVDKAVRSKKKFQINKYVDRIEELIEMSVTLRI